MILFLSLENSPLLLKQQLEKTRKRAFCTLCKFIRGHQALSEHLYISFLLTIKPKPLNFIIMKSQLILVKTLVCSQVTCNTIRECKYKPDRKYENRQDRETNDVAHCFKIDMLDSSCFAWLTRSSTWLTRCKIKHRTPCLRNFTTPSKLLRRQSPRYIDYEFSRQWFHVFSF